MPCMTKLDEIAVNIELVLISLIEGVALVTLAEQTVAVLQEPDWYRYIPYVLAGLAILLVFWAQSILHAVSFIRWPVRVEHMFLYFVSALLQIVAYASITALGWWFFWWTLFSIVALCMYVLDLFILRDSYKSFAKLKGGENFLKEVEKRHIFEMWYLVPLALAFNIAMSMIIFLFPDIFRSPLVYAIPGTLQFLFSVGALYDCTMNFRKRSAMIGKLFSEER